MSVIDILEALVLGIVEGLTEFIPVSSTGHLLLLGHFMGFESNGKTFEVVIQLGAILAIMTVYFSKLLRIVLSLPSDPSARRFVIGVIIAFIPAMILGALFHEFIKTVLFNPQLVCYTLIAGGLVLLAVDDLNLEVRYTDAMRLPLSVYARIGLFQCLAMVPGVSRSGATIVGAMLMGTDKRAAAEFSFFLAMPTMAAAFAYDLYKSRADLSGDDIIQIGVGFAAAFVVGFLVVRYLLDFVAKRGFAIFGWWRIVVGAAGLAAFYTIG